MPWGSSSRYARIKRAGDVVVAGGALLVLSPVMLATAAVVRAGLGRPVLFRQQRPGLHGEVFEILKFRTMRDPDPARGAVEDADRLTPLGRRLRASSLDELPGLINVLRGEMSLVGPRPLRTRYLQRYSREQAHRHDVPPGLTGLAQVAGRNAVSWDDRLDLDLEYVRTRSLATDLRILCATVPMVLRREGIAEEGQATMTDFYGPRRIGRHALRPAGGGAGGDARGDAWEVVDRVSGAVLARCALHGADAPGTGMSIEVLPGAPEPESVRCHAAEMLRGVQRERRDRAGRAGGPRAGAAAGRGAR